MMVDDSSLVAQLFPLRVVCLITIRLVPLPQFSIQLNSPASNEMEGY